MHDEHKHREAKHNEEDAMWYDDRIEAFVDGDLPDNEARMFSARMKVDSELREAVAAATALQSALRDMLQPRCPRQVACNVFEATETKRGWQLNWAVPTMAASAAALVLALNVGTWFGGPAQPSSEELAKARQDFAIAMGYLERASAAAGRQVVGQGIVEPVSDGLRRGLIDGALNGAVNGVGSAIGIDLEDAS